MKEDLVSLTKVLKNSSQVVRNDWCKQLLYKLNIIHNSFKNVHCSICLDNLKVDRNNQLVLVNVSEKPHVNLNVQDVARFKAPELISSSSRSKAGDVWAAGICIFYINNLFYPWEAAVDSDEKYCLWANKSIFPSSVNFFYSEAVKQMLCVKPESRPNISKVIKLTSSFGLDADDLSKLFLF